MSSDDYIMELKRKQYEKIMTPEVIKKLNEDKFVYGKPNFTIDKIKGE